MSVLRHTLQIFLSTCLCAVILPTFAVADETTDYINNPSFDVLDDMGIPVDWKIKAPEESGVYVVGDTETKKVGEASCKMYVGFNGIQKTTFMEQRPATSGEFALISAGTFYARAWVKTHEVNAIMGFQVVDHQANMPGGPPWFQTVKYDAFVTGSGTNDWELKEKKVEVASGANAIIFQMFLNKSLMPGCTAWVDGIEISLEPFTTAVHKTSRIHTQSKSLSFQGNRVTFTQPANYRLQIFSANGKRFVNRSGYGKSIDLHKRQLAPGYYIVKVQSELGELNRPFVVQSH